ncbi:excinuclease ABC subunit UvrC [Kiloniella laminariae]|uniref:UvrABC system protein C n=1 Tax=Kiloniella laminariae TaxID=454162 RepID=A0ABT4LLD1_9PROT|nr:excinuclease ABC subunit UvrC [Kiloniella laminariae]MCZ4281879.1 excinuclease ABC subunit UvrC [Kiloniella laminariae]
MAKQETEIDSITAPTAEASARLSGLSDAAITWEHPESTKDDSEGTSLQPSGNIARGTLVIQQVVKTLPNSPGVYRMLDSKGNALYVGKAKSLKKRVVSYTRTDQLPYRLKRMVSETRMMEIVRTNTEAEALLLESNLIKRLKPRYNVLLRDDKSFPYILITGDHEAPQVTKHRGAQKRDGRYFGPFADAKSVNQTITALEKAFLLRSCSDNVYSLRTRPCLMYQIKRCSAPCVGRVSLQSYATHVKEAEEFLSGSSTAFQQRMAEQMQQAAENQDYEQAAVYRDRIRALTNIQSKQEINIPDLGDADVFALFEKSGQSCIQVFFFRAGRNYGNRSYFPSHDRTIDSETVLTSFIAQFYANKPVPKLVLTSHELPEETVLAEALSSKAGSRVEVNHPQRGAKRKLLDNATNNAREALARRMAESASQRRLLEGLAEMLSLDSTPERVEVYDNSHTQGSEAYGGMIVAGLEGFLKKAYRKFKIRGDKPSVVSESAPAQENYTGGDDYAMMREVLTRRLSRSLKEDPDRQGDQWPDLLVLDGGQGQLTVGIEVLEELGLSDIPIVAIAKGQDRNAGRERIFLPNRPSFLVDPKDPVLYFIQRLRDEAHRYAIETHRKGRSKARLKSSLDDVPGIGSKRKKALLFRFGSADAVARAGIEDLAAVEGVSRVVAQSIYDYFNAE